MRRHFARYRGRVAVSRNRRTSLDDAGRTRDTFTRISVRRILRDEHESGIAQAVAVGRADGRRRVRRHRRPTRLVRPGQGSTARVQAQADAAAVVGGSVRAADRAGQWFARRHGHSADRQAQAARGTAAYRAQVGPTVPQRDARVPERGAVPVRTPAGRGPRALAARVRVRPQRVRRQVAGGRHRAGRPARPRLRARAQPGTRRRRRQRAHGLRPPGRGHRRARPVPRHVVHRQAEEPRCVPQAGGQPARDPVGRGRLAGQGQRAQVDEHARRPATDGSGQVPGRQAQRVPDHDPGGRPQPQAGDDAQGTVRGHMPRRLLQAQHTVRVRRSRTAKGRHDHRVHSRQVRFARARLVLLPVQERGQRRAGQPVGRPVGRVLGIGGGRAAGRRQGAHRGAAAPRAQVPRAIWLRAPVVRRAEHDQRQPTWAVGNRQRRRQDDRRRPAGRPDRRGRREDHRNPFRNRPAHHRPRLRGAIRVLQQFPSVGRNSQPSVEFRHSAYPSLFRRYVYYFVVIIKAMHF